MAVDPAVQFGAAGLNVPYAYQPVETRLNPPIQLPGTGELWAQVGRTAMAAVGQAGEMLQKSPLNPLVRAQMNYGVDQYRRAQDQIAAMRKLGPMGYMLGQTGPEGYSQVAPATITDPTMAARLMEAMKLGPQGKGGGPPPKVNEPTGQDGSGTPPAADQQKTPQAPPTTKEMGKPQTSAAPTTSNLSASTDNDFLLRRMMEQHEAAGLGGSSAAPEGTPSSLTFLNPATGNIESRMFAAPTAAPPPAAPAQPAPPPAQQPPQPDQTAMASWQAQNAHPVASSVDAVNWAKGYDTRTQDATYLPHGGPNATPAYAFHLKGGGTNIVPIAQMVKNGFGPSVAGQNTSAILSTSEALSNPPGQPPGMTLGATGQAPPGMQLQPPGQAPAAPGQPYQPVDYRTAAEQGQPPESYTGGPYQQAVAQAAAIPQNLIAQTAPAGQPAQPAPGQPLHPLADSTLSAADQAAVQAQGAKMPPASGKYTGDPVVPDTAGPYTYYRNDDPTSPSRGRVYTILPGPAGGYFNQQRWYLGTNQYETYELPNSAMRQTMWDKWGTNGYLTRDEINKMGPDEMKPWLQRAWQNENFQRSSPTTGINNTLDASEQLHNYLKQISDLQQTLASSGYTHLSTTDRMAAAAKNAAVSLGAGSISGMDGPTAAAIRALDQKVNQAQSLLKEHGELLLTPGEGGGQETPNIHVANWFRLGLPDIPASDIIRDAAFSGQDIKTRSKMLSALQQVADGRYKSLVDQAQTQWMRISDKHDANMIKMDQGRDFTDPGNLYTDHLLTVEPDEYEEFRKEHPNTKFKGTDGRNYWTPK